MSETCAQEQVCGNSLCYSRQVANGGKLVQSHLLDKQLFECTQSPFLVLC